MSAAHPAADFASDEVGARESEVCSHGERGYCHDDATHAERCAVEYTRRAAFSWAMRHAPSLTIHDDAEAFARFVVADNWRPGTFTVPSSLPREWERFAARR